MAAEKAQAAYGYTGKYQVCPAPAASLIESLRSADPGFFVGLRENGASSLFRPARLLSVCAPSRLPIQPKLAVLHDCAAPASRVHPYLRSKEFKYA